MKDITLTNHIYNVEITLNGQTYNHIMGDDGIDHFMTIYNDDSEAHIREGLRLLKNNAIPEIKIVDSGDGGIIHIRVIK